MEPTRVDDLVSLSDEEMFILGQVTGMLAKYDLSWRKLPDYIEAYGKAEAKARSMYERA